MPARPSPVSAARCVRSGHLPPCQPHRSLAGFTCLFAFFSLLGRPSPPPPQIPGQRIPGRLFASSPPTTTLLISFQPRVPLSSHRHQDRVHKMSFPLALPGCMMWCQLFRGPLGLSSVDHTVTPPCLLIIASSCICRWGSPPVCLFLVTLCLPSWFPSPEALPLLFLI